MGGYAPDGQHISLRDPRREVCTLRLAALPPSSLGMWPFSLPFLSILAILSVYLSRFSYISNRPPVLTTLEFRGSGLRLAFLARAGKLVRAFQRFEAIFACLLRSVSIQP